MNTINQVNTRLFLALSSVAILVISPVAHATEQKYSADPLNLHHTPQKPLEKGPHILPKIPYLHVDGNIRMYFFERHFGLANLPTQDAFSLGGKLNVLSEDCLNGIRFGATLYTAQPLGLNSKNPRKVDMTLPGKPVTALGQAFIQYENPHFLTRIGNQLITNPWMNAADSRMIPATYQGFYANLSPVTDFHLTAMRIIRFKSRISSSFSKSNLYSPINQATSLNALGNTRMNGTLAFGADYKQDKFKAQAWAYQFYDIAKLYYGDISYTLDTGTIINPLAAFQIGHEHNDGNRAFNTVGIPRKNSDLYGVLLGAEIADGNLSVGYNKIPKHPGSFQSGDIISPYTTSYVSDPLYTTSMIAGLIEKTAGSALKGTLSYAFFATQLRALISYAKYRTMPFTANTSESNFDLTYAPNGKFKNLSLRYRVGLLRHNPAFGRFMYQRLMFEYDFSN